MAVGIMSASLLLICLLQCFLHVAGQGDVFRGAPQAHGGFLRSKRANQFLLEEILQGNLERECHEELCNREEAREVFEDEEKTDAFWTSYPGRDQCEPNPCLHGGNCSSMMGEFSCSCSTRHHGPICELEEPGEEGRPPSAPQYTTPEVSECPTDGPTACDQLCTASYFSFTCSCMSGFKLQSDGRSCSPEVEFPCGRFPDNAASMCRHANCPWQVYLLNRKGVALCSGVVLGRRSVLTAAHCLNRDSGSELRPSDLLVLAGNRNILLPVRALYLHNRFRPGHHDNDLALLELARPLPYGSTIVHLCLPTRDFSENILMHPGRTGITSKRRGDGEDRNQDLDRNQGQDLVYMTLEECRRQLNVSHPLSNKMFCMRRDNGSPRRANRTRRSPKADLQNHMGPSGNPHGTQTNPNGAQRNLNVLFQNQHGHLRNQNGSQGRWDEPLGNQHGHSGNQNETQRPDAAQRNVNVVFQNQDGPLGNQSGTHRSPNGAQRSPDILPDNPNRQLLNHAPAGRRLCGGLLPGSPVATAERGTVFLTGLLISSSAECGAGSGLVFTKLSRYLSWIRPKLEAAEDHMTPQVNEYPESR